MGQALLSLFLTGPLKDFTGSIYQQIDIIPKMITEQGLTKLVNVVKGLEIKESQEGGCPRWREGRRDIAMYR